MFSFGLSLGKPLYVPEGGFKVLEPAVLSTEIGTPATITLNASNTDSYAVTNLPAWCTLNSLTGEITATPDGTEYGQEKFDVVLTNIDGDLTIADGLTISVFREQNLIASLTNGEALTQTDEQNELVSIGAGGASVQFYDIANDYWKGLVHYYTAYGKNNQFFILNYTTNTVEADITDFMTNELAGGRWITANNLETYFRFNTELVRYNQTTMQFENISTLPSILGSGILYPTLELGIDGKLICGGQDSNGELATSEYNIATNTWETWTNINGDGDPCGNRNAAADSTHLYSSTNGNGSGYRVYSADKATTTGLKLANCPTWVTVTQGKYGCWVNIPDGSTAGDGITPLTESVYWLYNGALVPATNGLNQDTCPWDNQGEDFVINTGEPIPRLYSIDMGGVIPKAGSSNSSVWYKELITSSWVKVPITGVLKYPIDLVNIIASKSGGEIIGIGDTYNGFSVKNVDTQVVNNYNGLLSNYSRIEMNGKIYFSGYPSGMTYEYDPALPWDNTAGDYDPNVSQGEGANPKFIGYTRYNYPDTSGVIPSGSTGGGQHKNFALVDGGNGLLWCIGEYERDGSGVGITIIDTLNNYSTEGLRDIEVMENHTPRGGGCATDNYIVALCEVLTVTANTLDLSVTHRDTKVTHNVPLPVEAVLKYGVGVYGSSIINYGEDKVLIASANATDNTLLIAIDLTNDTVIYNKTVINSVSNTGGPLELRSDGNIYLTADGNNYIVDPVNGLLESLGNLPLAGRGVEGSDGKLYSINGDKTYSCLSATIPEAFQLVPQGTEISTTPVPIGAGFTMVDNGDNTYRFNFDGTYTGYNSIWMNALVQPTNTCDWKFTVTDVSGYVKWWDVEVIGGGTFVNKVLTGYEERVGVTLTENIVGTNIRLKFYQDGTVGQFTLAVHSVKERDS